MARSFKQKMHGWEERGALEKHNTVLGFAKRFDASRNRRMLRRANPMNSLRRGMPKLEKPKTDEPKRGKFWYVNM